MRKRRHWIAVGAIASVLAVGVVLAGIAAPGSRGKAIALGDTPAPWPSPSASVILQVGHDGNFAKEYTLGDLQALNAGASIFNGWAGFMNSGSIVYGPDSVSGVKVADVVQDALGAALGTSQSVQFVGADGYKQTYSQAQLANPDSMTQMYDATTKKPVSTTTYAGPFASVLVYSDPAGNVFNPLPWPNVNGDGPLRLMVADGDSTNENVVMTGSDSVKWIVKLDVFDTVAKDFNLKLTGLKIRGVRQTRTIRRADFQSCVNCHGSSYSASGHTWSGTPLYLLVAQVDGGQAMSYNVALARKGYRIKLTSTTGRWRIVSSRAIIHRSRIVLAWERDGLVLANNLFPLRLIGPRLKASQELGRIKSVTLLPPLKK